MSLKSCLPGCALQSGSGNVGSLVQNVCGGWGLVGDWTPSEKLAERGKEYKTRELSN